VQTQVERLGETAFAAARVRARILRTVDDVGSKARYLLHRVAVRDLDVGHGGEQLVQEGKPPRRCRERGIAHEEVHDASRLAVGGGQRGVVVNPQVAGEEDDGGLQDWDGSLRAWISS
jgi:hypothetical protein